MKKIVLAAVIISSYTHAAEPIELDFDTTGIFYNVRDAMWKQPSERSALWETVDFSTYYYNYLIWDYYSQNGNDVTKDLRGFNIDVVDLFSSYTGNSANASPQNGVFGPLYKRLQIYISDFSKQDKDQSITIYGASKRGKQIHQFTGTVKIEKILRRRRNDNEAKGDTVSYTLIGSYVIKEDKSQEGAGVFKGIYSANVKAELRYDFLKNSLKREIWNNNQGEPEYGYSNRNFVGTWTSYATGEQLKAIWGDNQLPFPLDFKIGIGEHPNPKYIDADWENYLNPENETEASYDEEGNQNGYKLIDEWWNR